MTDPRPSAGDAAQVRLIVEQVVDAAMVRLGSRQSEKEPSKMELPPSIKWAAGIVSAVITAAVIGFMLWMVTTLNDMQLTVARIDERQQSQGSDVDGRFQDFDRRVMRLEGIHARERNEQ